jgi:hypothetical protein
MKKYVINIEEILCTSVEVDAETIEDAIEIAKKMYNNEEIILNANDITGTNIMAQEIDENGDNAQDGECTEWTEL